MNQIVGDWDEFVSRIGNEVEELGNMGDPARFDAGGDALDVDMFLDVLAELEQRGVQSDRLVAVTSPNQLVGLLERLDAASRVSRKDLDDDEEPPLPEEASIFGVPIRVEPGFPEQTLVMFPPEEVTFEGRAIRPSNVGVLESLSVPDLSGDESITLSDVLGELLDDEAVRVEAVEDAAQDGDEDPERKGERFVADGGYVPAGESAVWAVALGEDPDGDLVVQAITEDVELEGVDALEHRFYITNASNSVVEAGTDAGASPVALYSGVMVHSCNGDGGGDCELYTPPGLDEEAESDGTATLDDLPNRVAEAVGQTLGLEVVEPSDLDSDGEPLGEDAVNIPIGEEGQ